jgi:hypothetical protein
MEKKQLSTEARIAIAFVLSLLALAIAKYVMSPSQSAQQETEVAAPNAQGSQSAQLGATQARRLLSALSHVGPMLHTVCGWMNSLAWYSKFLLFVVACVAGFCAGWLALYWLVSVLDEIGTRGYIKFAKATGTGVACLLFLGCLSVCGFMGLHFLTAAFHAATRIRPTAWAWYWRLLLLVGSCVLGLFAVFVALALKDQSAQGWSALMWIITLACLTSTVLMGVHFLKVGYRTVLPRVDLVSVGVAAAVALVGSLIVNSVDRSAFSRSGTHEWRFIHGGRYKDATNRDVWEHVHGSGSWAARVHRQRIVWAVVAVTAGLITLASRNSPLQILALCATAGANLVAVTVVSMTFRR